MEQATGSVKQVDEDVYLATVRCDSGMYIEMPPRGSLMESEHDLRVLASRLHMAIDYAGVDRRAMSQRRARGRR